MTLDLDALERLERIATKGEWLVAVNGRNAETCLRFIWRNDYGGALSPEGRNVGCARVASHIQAKDAEFVAALRNAAPELLAAARAAERLRAEVVRMREVIQADHAFEVMTRSVTGEGCTCQDCVSDAASPQAGRGEEQSRG